ncbi:MAG: hypothetical protein EZS28_041475, partial [Streblomastix strix]
QLHFVVRRKNISVSVLLRCGCLLLMERRRTSLRNQQVVFALLKSNIEIIPETNIDLSYKEPYHGKSKVDAFFATYETALRQHMDENGVNSLIALKEKLQHITFIEGVQVGDIQQAHEIIVHVQVYQIK